MEKILNENLQFTTHNKVDFGYTISSDSKIHVLGLVQEINKSITFEITNVGGETNS